MKHHYEVDAVLLAVTARVAYEPTFPSALGLLFACALWLGYVWIVRPIPEAPRTDEARLLKLEADVKAALQAAESAKTAAGIRNMR